MIFGIHIILYHLIDLVYFLIHFGIGVIKACILIMHGGMVIHYMAGTITTHTIILFQIEGVMEEK